MSIDIASAESEISDVFNRNIQLVGDPEEALYTIPVSASELMTFLASSLFETVQQLTPRELNITEEEVVEMFEWLLTARCWYVCGGHGVVHPRDIEYPALFGPVLAAVGRYRDETSNVTIIPAPDRDDLVVVDEKTGLVKEIKKKVRLQQPKAYSKVMSALRVGGVPTIFGLPMGKDAPSDEMFRMDIVDNTLRGCNRQAPSPTTAFARTLVQMAYMASLFGQARVQYAAVASIRSSILDLVLRNVRGPRVSTS
jgi:hypothetical protein